MNKNPFKFNPAAGIAAAIALSALCFVGCADRQPIPFSAEHMATLRIRPDAPVPSSAKPEMPGLSKLDLFAVETAVYNNLLQRHPWEATGLAAVFLQGDDDEVDALIRLFPNNIPPIKRSSSVDLRPGLPPKDKDTGKTAIILSVEVTNSGTDTAQAIGKWYAGGATSGSCTYDLKKTGSEWVIQNFK